MVINKIDRSDARPQEVLNEIYDLFIDLDAKEDQLDFPVLYTNAKTGTASTDLKVAGENLQPLFEAIVKTIPLPSGDIAGPLQILVANLDYSDYLGRLAIARVFNGRMFTGEDVVIAKRDGSMQKTKITKLFSFSGLKRTDITETELGDIIAVAGVEGITIGETITNVDNPAPLPPIVIDEARRSVCNSRSIPRRLPDAKALMSLHAICASAWRKNCLPMSRYAWKTPDLPTCSRFLVAENCSYRF